MLLSCFRVCLFRVVFLLPCGCKFGSSRTHGRVEPPHDTVQDHCEASAFCVSSLAMAVWTTHIAHYCAISKSPQCLPLIDSLIKTSLVMCWLPKCTKNVACLPTTRMIKDEENWEKSWKLTARCHIVYRSACHNHCSLLYSSHRICHRHGGCHSHSPCHGGRSVVPPHGGCDRHCVIVVVTAASLQGHGCQGSKEKCSLSAGNDLN